MSKHRQLPIAENILVEDYAAEGKSLSRVNGKVIFIENAVPGDVVDVQLFKNKKDWAEGKALYFREYSQDRVVPFCKHFGVCGGCQWQNLPYEKQLVYKQKQVADNLQRIGKISLPQINSIIGCEQTRRYRNKLEYTFSNKQFIPANTFKQMNKEEANIAQMQGAAGFHTKGVFDKVVDIDVCHLQEEPTNAIRKFIKQYASNNGLPFYDIKQHTGWLRTMQVRNTLTGELMINVVFGYENKQHIEKLFKLLLEEFPQITTLLYTINIKWNDSLYDLQPQTYYGKGYITEQLENFKFKISPKSFFQTNSNQATVLYNVVRNYAELNGQQTLYDLYCGTGSIGIFASRLAKKIVGVDTEAEAIADAKENALLNNMKHASFFAGDVIRICNDNFFESNGKPDVIITDPPRAGMHEKLIEKLLEVEAPLVVYVSCNPATQARDLALLNEKYSVEKIQPVDMFPHTHHIENVVQLKLK